MPRTRPTDFDTDDSTDSETTSSSTEETRRLRRLRDAARTAANQVGQMGDQTRDIPDPAPSGAERVAEQAQRNAGGASRPTGVARAEDTDSDDTEPAATSGADDGGQNDTNRTARPGDGGAPSEQVQRAAGFGTAAGTPDTVDRQRETREEIRDEIASQFVQSDNDLSDPDQVRVSDVRRTDDGGFAGDIALTDEGQEVKRDAFQDAVERMGTTGRQFLNREQARRRQLSRENFAEDAQNQLARQELREQFAGERDDLQASDVSIDTRGGEVSANLTVGGRSRQLVARAAEESEFTRDQLVVSGTDGGGLSARASDEAFRERVASQNPDVTADDLQVETRTAVRPSDRSLFETAGADDLFVSPNAETGTERRVAVLTPDAQARRLSDQLEDKYPNSEISIEFTGEDGRPVARVEGEGVIDTGARVAGSILEGDVRASGPGGLGPGVAIPMVTPREAQDVAVGFSREFVEGGEAILSEGTEGLDRDLGTIGDVGTQLLGEGGSTGGMFGGPGAAVPTSPTALEIGRDIARVDPADLGREFVAGGRELTTEFVEGAQRDAETVSDIATGSEPLPLGPGVSSFVDDVGVTGQQLAASPFVAAPASAATAGALAEPTPFGEIGLGTTAAAAGVGVALGTGAAIGAEELNERTRSVTGGAASELGVGEDVGGQSELGVPDEDGVSELDVGEFFPGNELGVGGFSTGVSEFGIPESDTPVGEEPELSFGSTTGDTTGGGGVTPDIDQPGENLPTPGGPSITDGDSSFDGAREFPTGAGAVVGEDTSGSDGFGEADSPTVEVGEPTVGIGDGTTVDPGSGSLFGPEAGSGVDAGNTARGDVFGDANTFVRPTTDVLADTAAGTGLSDALGYGSPGLSSGFGSSTGFGTPEQFQFEQRFQYQNEFRPRRPRRLPELEFDDTEFGDGDSSFGSDETVFDTGFADFDIDEL